ncbi:MAG: acetolactate synthase, partial [Rhodobacteraceae bacterium]|nr:acetolactate synthase [Paracoccaceae bacterium]
MSENNDHNSANSLSIAGGLILPRLKVLSIEHIYVNSGTDFPPIIEGLAEATFKGIPFSEPILVPHEHVAMGMAYGNYKVSRSPQAVILHTNVGLANATTGIINAA